MNLFYIDTSVIVSLLFEEHGHKEFRKILKTGRALSSYFIEAELYSVAKREGVALDIVRRFVEPLFLFTPSRPIAFECERILKEHYCRGADIYHLASALFLAPNPRELKFVTCDNRQGAIAKALGFL